jgi:hypothetical protein
LPDPRFEEDVNLLDGESDKVRAVVKVKVLSVVDQMKILGLACKLIMPMVLS